ncbi:DUF2125 domain-containing protein [Pseudorhodobacter antarcticus]|nr:DUF2125 domain-containing protein [Pseudorhodobacter antarcticus]
MIFTTAPAFADVTPEEVWQSWQDLGGVYGQTYSAGSQTRAGDSLIVKDMKIAVDQDGTKLSGTLPEVTFRDMGDGRVEVGMPATYALQMETLNGVGKPVTNSITVTQAGVSLIASGTAQDVTHDFSADTVGLRAADVVVDSEPRDMAFDLTMSKLAMMYRMAAGDMVATTSTFAAQRFDYKAAGKPDAGAGSFDVSGSMVNLAGASAGAMPKGAIGGDMIAQLAQGMNTDASFTYDSGNLTVAGTDENSGKMNFASTSQGGTVNVSVDKARLAYGLTGRGVQMTASGSSIPFPELTAGYDTAGLTLLIPVAKSDEPRDFVIETRLEGLTVSDMIWSMVDPGATLPRDPATLIMSLKGTAKVLADLMVDDGPGPDMMESPFQVETLDIDALQLTVAGAELKGDGALTFDNAQAPILGGVAPMPVGKVNLSLTGATGLLEKLVALGLVDPQMTAMFGMFAGMLAKPGPTPDSLIAEVEIKEGGQILSNGNPLPF